MHPLAHLNLGHALADAGRPQEAIPHFREALRLKPDYAEAHYNWGVALDTAGRPAEARIHYERAVHLSREVGDEATALVDLGNLLGVAREEHRAGRMKTERLVGIARELLDRAKALPWR